jgi:hypothetical protein
MEGNKANLLPLTNENGKALSLICSLVTPCGFIMEQTKKIPLSFYVDPYL